MQTRTPEEDLLRDALELDPNRVVTLISREPLGEGSVAGFDVGGEDGSLTYFVDTSRRPVAVETGLATGTPDQPGDRVWLHPADPHLPALAPAAFGHAVGALLARLGIDATGAPMIAAYRPGRRAVLRVPASGVTVWVKVVRPTRAARIIETHRALAAAGIPLPGLRGWSDEGLLVLEDARGTPAQDAPWQPAALIDQVDGLRRAFAAVPLDVQAATGMLRRLSWYAERLRIVLDPEGRRAVDAVESRAREQWADDDSTTIHGDLHFGQLFLDDEQRISAVIDVDTAGSGSGADDEAAFLAHAVASALLTPPEGADRVWDLAAAAMERWDDGSVGGGAFRARAATHLLGHSLGAWETGDAERSAVLRDAAASVVGGRIERPRESRRGT